ncbi:hypothetical protein C8J56DRAFT_370170 [Mycena floridula]|nr:hypothetical protein C8J56DRAFT_409044 [Mycena floridula]KAJ7577310.1 hypothetical protein C8J56DRAFT_370170 [Mycena floridula]
MMNPEAELRRMRRLHQHQAQLGSSFSNAARHGDLQQQQNEHCGFPPAIFSPSLGAENAPLCPSAAPRQLSLYPISLASSHDPGHSPSCAPSQSSTPAAASSSSVQSQSSSAHSTNFQPKSNNVEENSGGLEESRKDERRLDDEDDARPSKRRRLIMDCSPSPISNSLRDISSEKAILTNFSSNRATTTHSTDISSACPSTSPADDHSSGVNHQSCNTSDQSSSPDSSDNANLALTTLNLPPLSRPVSPFKASVTYLPFAPDLELNDELMYLPGPQNGSVEFEMMNETTHFSEPEELPDAEAEPRDLALHSETDWDLQSDIGSDESNESVDDEDWMSEFSEISSLSLRRRRLGRRAAGKANFHRGEEVVRGFEDEDSSEEREEEQEKCCYRRTGHKSYCCTVPGCTGGPFKERWIVRKHARNVHGLGEGPDVRCPIRPCRGRLQNKESCKIHIQERHPGQWNDSIVLEYVVPSDPYALPQKLSPTKGNHVVSQKVKTPWPTPITSPPRPTTIHELPRPKVVPPIPRHNMSSMGRSIALPLPKPVPLSHSPLFGVTPRRFKPALPISKPLPSILPLPRLLPSDNGVKLEMRPGLPPQRKSGSSRRPWDLSNQHSSIQSSSNLSDHRHPSKQSSVSSRLQLSRKQLSSNSEIRYDTNHSGSPPATNKLVVHDLDLGQDPSDLSDLSDLTESEKEEEREKSVAVRDRKRSKRLGARKLKCPWTGCSFETKYMAVHLRSHTGERPYECRYPDCNSRFLDYSARNKHEYAHTGERPFKCSKCSKIFGRKGHLETHQSVHRR